MWGISLMADAALLEEEKGKGRAKRKSSWVPFFFACWKGCEWLR